MGKFIIAVSFIVVCALAVNTYVTSNAGDTVKSENARIANKGITEMKKVEN